MKKKNQTEKKLENVWILLNIPPTNTKRPAKKVERRKETVNIINQKDISKTKRKKNETFSN